MIREHLSCEPRSSRPGQKEQQAARSQAGLCVVYRGQAQRAGVREGDEGS